MRFRTAVMALLAVLASLLVFGPSSADARGKATVAKKRPAKKKPGVVFAANYASHPSVQYGSLDEAACLAELRARKVTFQAVPEARGVRAPVRLPKDVGGVVYRTEVPAPERPNNPHDVFDCRLVLALHDFSRILSAHDVSEVLIFSAWRPPPSSWPEGKEATRHPGALAIDIRVLRKKPVPPSDKPVDIVVQKQWKAALGRAPCGKGASPILPSTPEAKALRSIVCQAVDQHLFTSVLTPNYNRAHHNHVHLEVTPGAKWHLTR